MEPKRKARLGKSISSMIALTESASPFNRNVRYNRTSRERGRSGDERRNDKTTNSTSFKFKITPREPCEHGVISSFLSDGRE